MITDKCELNSCPKEEPHRDSALRDFGINEKEWNDVNWTRCHCTCGCQAEMGPVASAYEAEHAVCLNCANGVCPTKEEER